MALGAGILPSLALAQAVPPVAGVPTRDQLRGVTGEAPPPEQPRLTISGGIERSPCPLADPKYQDIKVTVSHVTFNGLKGATAEELEAAWKPLAGTPQPVAALCDIRDAAGTILRNKGYLAAVQVPTQRIENGEVRMEVLYARVTAIRARGETRGAERKLQEYLGHLTKDEIFDRNKAERYLLLARDLPGYNVQLTLRPAGGAPGDMVGEVTVLRLPFVADLSVQNLASEATGRWGAQLRVQAFGLTGLGDATTLSYYATADFHEQHILQASHEFRPGSDGLIVGGQFTYAWTQPDIGPVAGGAALKARTLYASLYGRYPLLRSQRANVWLGAGFDLVNQNVELIGPLTRDRLRVLWTRLDADAIDMKHAAPAWRASGSLELRQGLDILDATHGCAGIACIGRIPTSRFDGSPTATVVRAQGEYERALGKVAVAVMPRAQYAFKPLLSFEEFSAGNYTVGRGYDPGEVIGDSAVGVSFELRGPRLRVGGGDVRVQPFVFCDAAWAWNKGIAGADRLTSAGGGVRAELGERFRLDATLAVPLERTRIQTRRSDPRFLVTLTTRLLPWRAN
ncbi:ShlB/FhaC/HecB family hemolysin secretion/activation protein [Novosphingobium sp. KCTC 2891]|nr:ShlB/FhaC/HecB family hemolysin secretion/activation protein [Novosphingobium sp. KCTC 2891]